MSQSALAEPIKLCVTKLQETKGQAQSILSNKTLTKFFLESLDKHLTDHIQKLKEWKDTLKPVDTSRLQGQGSLEDPVRRAYDACSLIQERTSVVQEKLRDATSASVSGQLPGNSIQQDIEDAVGKIANNIDNLDRLAPIFLQGDLRTRILRTTQNWETLQSHFESRIRSLPVDDRRDSFRVSRRPFRIRFETFNWFWEHVPAAPNLPRGVRFPDRGDGVIYTEQHVTRVKAVLQSFYDAWIVTHTVYDPQSLSLDTGRLSYMLETPKIVLVLKSTNKLNLLNNIVENEIRDSYMDSDPRQVTVQNALGAQGPYIADQYSRVKERPWPDGTQLDLHEDEPLPLQIPTVYKKATGAAVDKVCDAWHPDQIYARKVVFQDKVASEYNLQIDNEIDCLKMLSKEDHGHHIIKFVKTYKRGQEKGMLLRPVADMNLNDLLGQCCRDYEEREKRRPDLLRACGCLVYSLCYLHNARKIRHRDIKPHNILCLKQADGGWEFILADFGLAWNFAASTTRQLTSGTSDRDFKATPQYEAPEINQQADSYHGRSADVFSLGCVFLEIASVLTMSSKAYNDHVPLRTHWFYKQNIPKLEAWGQSMVRTLQNKDKSVRKILQLGLEMIQENPKKRPKIGKVFLRLESLPHTDSRTPYPFCERCISKRQDSGHKELLEWTKWDWLHPLRSLSIAEQFNR